MILRPYYYFDTGCAAYRFGSGLGKCAVVDPHERDVDAYMAFAEAKGMKITRVFETHVHADHRSGGAELARDTPGNARENVTRLYGSSHQKLSRPKEEFGAALAEVPPRPAQMESIMRFNKGDSDEHAAS